jgi:hypothetical protein
MTIWVCRCVRITPPSAGRSRRLQGLSRHLHPSQIDADPACHRHDLTASGPSVFRQTQWDRARPPGKLTSRQLGRWHGTW